MSDPVGLGKTKSNVKSSSKSKSMTSTRRQLALFGQPLVLHGEDAAAYQKLLARIREAKRPADFIDEVYIDDVISSQWDAMRLRRLKLGLIKACELKALEAFLEQNLDYDLYSDYFADDLAEALQDELGEEQADFARSLARKCARNEPDALAELEKILPTETPQNQSYIDLLGAVTRKPNMDSILNDARSRKVSEVIQDYTRAKPAAVKLIAACWSRPARA